MFRAATEHALEEKLPLFYLAANAGARVGLAQEVKQCLQVCLNLTLPPCSVAWKLREVRFPPTNDELPLASPSGNAGACVCHPLKLKECRDRQ